MLAAVSISSYFSLVVKDNQLCMGINPKGDKTPTPSFWSVTKARPKKYTYKLT